MPIVASNIESEDFFPYAAMKLAPPLLGAVAIAGILVVALSTASSLFQQVATALSRDIYQRYINPTCLSRGSCSSRASR